MRKVYLVQLPEKKLLTVPKHLKPLAIPLFELYDNSEKYGIQLAALPLFLSRFDLEIK